MQLEGPTAAGFMYSDSGGDGPVVVLLHRVLMNGTLWDEVVGRLRDRYRCIGPELPFGTHTTPMPDDADLTLVSLATLIAGSSPNSTCATSQWSATTGAARNSSSAPAAPSVSPTSTGTPQSPPPRDNLPGYHTYAPSSPLLVHSRVSYIAVLCWGL